MRGEAREGGATYLDRSAEGTKPDTRLLGECGSTVVSDSEWRVTEPLIFNYHLYIMLFQLLYLGLRIIHDIECLI